MPKQLIVNNTPYDYPTPGDEPGWGEGATGWATEVTNVLANILGPNDILETSFSIANNQSTFADITDLAFNAASVRSAEITYAIYRRSDVTPSGVTETGKIHIAYDNAAGWLIGMGDVVGNSGVVFNLTAAGQLQYQSTDIDSLNYQGVMKFKASALEQ